MRLRLVKVRLHDGVIRDIERQNRKKENIRLLGEQIILTEQLEAEREKMLLAKGSQKT
ncbi:protein PET117 homolog, mitochondrial [Ursus maritimus]|uniref:Protein PET117 homolog, mitochondrial n=1 Tax=Ursus maritimus TaxID=29073 RepID=A0A8M1GI37_URSMA|nr:protein PET117 homolog, mitochondrial [Ursus maritimus]